VMSRWENECHCRSLLLLYTSGSRRQRVGAEGTTVQLPNPQPLFIRRAEGARMKLRMSIGGRRNKRYAILCVGGTQTCHEMTGCATVSLVSVRIAGDMDWNRFTRCD
jgi:hypothetical protein